MAKQAKTADRGDKETGIVGRIADAFFRPFEMVGAAIGTVAGAIFRDGTLAAAGRQGIDELGAALKPFPDSIQVHETGTIWNPTPGEVQKSRDPEALERKSWSSLAAPQSAKADDHNRQRPGLDHGFDNGHEHDAGHSM